MRLIAITFLLPVLLGRKTILCFDANPSFSRGERIVHSRRRLFDELVRSDDAACKLDDNMDHYSVNINQRRRLIGAMLSIPFSLALSTGAPSMVLAVGGDEIAKTKPFAPIENLLPAVRVKLSIDSALELTRSIMTLSSDDEKSTPIKIKTKTSAEGKALEQLESVVLKPQYYVQSNLKLQGVPPKPGEIYLQPYKPMKGDLPFQRFLIQNGDVDSWKRLKKAEKRMERSSEVRAALNAYTDALTFSTNSYVLNVDKDTRSSMVRQDRLPDVKQVITSDMGMRYLYRNQVLTAMDDVKAELEFQLIQVEREGIFNGDELLDLLLLARTAMERWLSLVPSEDLNQAMKFVASPE